MKIHLSSPPSYMEGELCTARIWHNLCKLFLPRVYCAIPYIRGSQQAVHGPNPFFVCPLPTLKYIETHNEGVYLAHGYVSVNRLYGPPQKLAENPLCKCVHLVYTRKATYAKWNCFVTKKSIQVYIKTSNCQGIANLAKD